MFVCNYLVYKHKDVKSILPIELFKQFSNIELSLNK